MNFIQLPKSMDSSMALFDVFTNVAGWQTDPDSRCISYIEMGMFQPAMLVYQRVYDFLHID